MKKILFLHTNFPAQYRRLAPYLTESGGFDVRAGTLKSNAQKIDFTHVKFERQREARPDIHPALMRTETALLTGQEAYSALHAFRSQGWLPDIVCAHSGFGAGMFVKDVFPQAKYLAYHEWYFNGPITDEGHPCPPDDHNALIRSRMANLPFLVDLAAMDAGVTPTRWQKSQFPTVFQTSLHALHDGLDTDFYAPRESTILSLGNDLSLTQDDDVITYVARGMEPYRGFPQFMEAVARVQKENPKVHAIVVGNDRVAYGSKRSDGMTYKEHALKTYDLDTSRIHFTGLVSFEQLRAIFRVSSVHVYLTVPFVLSWSMLEAMSTGCVILGSATPPVQEVIEDGENGFLTDLFDVDMLAERIVDLLGRNSSLGPIRQAARGTVTQKYSARNMLPCQRQLLLDML
jgi:glycosyltransferase involved in cell wall biosynthesis